MKAGNITILDPLGADEICSVDPEAARDCRAAGDVGESCRYWARRAKWVADRAALVAALRATGAWDDLEDADLLTLRARILFTFIPDCAEEDD